MMTAGVLTGHPDVRWRHEALHSYSRHEYDIALDQFLRAARYGDKPAQAMLAEMYWKGTGVAQDRPRGYAWMDIAAERRFQIGRAQVCTPGTNAHLVSRLLLEKKKTRNH